ncbi:MAG: hypothetical protein UHO63_03710 [Blautia sp.]|nr:hypothetical protein [Blautia sp.]
MKRKGLWNALFVVLCIALVVALGGMLSWGMKKDSKERERLEKLATESVKTNKGTSGTSKKEEKEKEAEEQEKPEETPKQPEKAPEEKTEGVVCWGDDLINGEDSATYSYKVVLQNLLTENGYNLPVQDKTLQGAGTMSVMTMAGVPENEVQAFIDAHKAAANGGELPITETGIRDLTPEQLERTDFNCIPIISMGYYGGWNHDPQELIQQQENILKTFPNQEQFIIIGVRPFDDSVNSAALDTAMREKWGEHYISASEVTGVHVAASFEGQAAIAQAVFEKLETLGYIEKQ